MADSDVIDYRKTFSVSHGIRFLFECSKSLELKSATLRSAAIFYHKFFRVHLKEQYKYDPYIIAAAALLLSSKVNNEPCTLRDVINVCYHNIHRNATPLALGKKYFDMRDALIQAELLLLRVLHFDTECEQVKTPLYLLTYLEALQNYVHSSSTTWQAITQLCWPLLHDFFLNYKVLDYQPQMIAVAIIMLALECYAIEVPLNKDRKPWYEPVVSSMSKEKLNEIVSDVVRVYSKR